MEINEIFFSIQGETKDVGRPCVFIRTQFCPLRCAWCDSEKTWFKNAGKQMALEEILAEVAKYPIDAMVCITGGEPLRHKVEVITIIQKLKTQNKFRHITVETDGAEDITTALPEDNKFGADSIVMDWKLPSSNMNHNMLEDNLKRLRGRDQLKFIVWYKSDLKVVEEIAKKTDAEILVGCVEGFNDKAQEETVNAKQVVEWMKEFSKDVPKIRFQIQLHKLVGER